MNRRSCPTRRANAGTRRFTAEALRKQPFPRHATLVALEFGNAIPA